MTEFEEFRQRYAEADGQPITRVRAERFQSIAEDAINRLAWGDKVTKDEVREIVREVLEDRKPFRGGWFTALNNEGVPVRRWRDAVTGEVYFFPNEGSVGTGHNFESVYHNAQWEDDAPVRQDYPPAGLPVMVKWSETDFWFIALSCGNGKFLMGPSLGQEKPADWRYIPANWDNAPEECTQWIVTSTGEQDWVSRSYKVGEQYYDGCTVVHVEGRP